MICDMADLVIAFIKASHRAIELYELERAAGMSNGLAEMKACGDAAEYFVESVRGLPVSEGGQ